MKYKLNYLLQIKSIQNDIYIINIISDQKLNLKLYLNTINEIYKFLNILREFPSSFSEEFFLNLGYSKDFFHALKKHSIIIKYNINSGINKSLQHRFDRNRFEALLLHYKQLNERLASDTYNKDHIDNKTLDSKIDTQTNIIKLPKHHISYNQPLYKLLLSRRSNNIFTSQKIDLKEVSYILDSISEFQRDSNYLGNIKNRLKIYIVIYKRNKSILAGLYKYNIETHSLLLVREGNFNEEVIKICIGQNHIKNGLITMFFCTKRDNIFSKNSNNGTYITVLEKIAEIVHYNIISATSLGFNTFITPAFEDQLADIFLSLNKNQQSLLYTLTIG